ncbi:hypothetical protein [Propionicicella superfundia]|uniref:hypothetical protein n=1 Tax=Propionicicella superfundia TaxID=348582 RepID=UPI00041538FE|nr:hypothetical protein [Propionicicella superfundia]
MTSGSARCIPISGLDRQWVGQQTTAVIGPLDLPPVSDLRAAFVELAELDGRTRAGWTIDARRRRWCFDPGRLAELAEEVVHAGEPALPEGEPAPAEILAAIERLSAGRNRERLPLSITRAGDLLLWDQSHALGDAQLLLGMTSALVGVATTGLLPKWVAAEPSRHPLLLAVRHAFGQRSGRFSGLIRDRLSAVRPFGRRSEPAATATEPWEPAMASVFTVFDRSSWESVQRWRRAQAPDASMASVYLVLMRLALREAGVPVSPDTLVLYDCRRHLPRGACARGNFVVGIRQRFADDPIEVGDTLSRTFVSGRPLATMAVSTAKRRFARQGPPRSVSSSPVIVPAFAFAPRSRDVELMPWRRKDLRCYSASTTPAAPDAVTLATMLVGGRLSATWSFHRNVIPEKAMRRALQVIGDDPVALLEASRPV